MKQTDLYYLIKPMIPRSLQLALRRGRAAHKRKIHAGDWPIQPLAAKKPEGWAGWPGNRKFALVLQHDVDTMKGLRKCPALMDAEIRLGFRSCFNFVPEDYAVPPDLIRKLAASGFEVGVHGLRHDGKLFRHPERFAEKALRIGHYLREWGAVGFTSPSMLRDFRLMAELDIEHGCSSFDTDPFEPQSEGVNTIFPFFVDNASGAKSYVEIPYTLAQDHGLFIILSEKDNRIWKDKLAWIAAQGGMAALNSHPDYMGFGGAERGREEYPVDFYAEFLEHIRDKYAGQYWHVLPRELARFWREAGPERKGGGNKGEAAAKRPAAAGAGPAAAEAHASPGAKIWIDLDNTPHVPFFMPIIRELEGRGHQVCLTVRDAFQVCELAEAKGLTFSKIGHHYGKNRMAKAIGLLKRSVELYRFSRAHRPDIALSHSGRSQILLFNILRKPSILLSDYEHSRFLRIALPTWLIVPEAIWGKIAPVKLGQMRYYPGIKEDVYVPDFRPDHSLPEDLGIPRDRIVITVRPPANEAHYHNPESDLLFFELMARVCRTPGVQVVLLPRNQNQEQSFRDVHPEWFAESRTIVPPKAIDGLNLIWHSDLVVSGGGTMNREAAALSVPVYSIFRGTTGAVDEMLERQGRLTMIRNKEEVWSKIPFEVRPRQAGQDGRPREALTKILYHIENIIEIERARRRR